MGVQYSYPYHLYSYKDVQNCIQMGEDKCIIINTLEEKYQECLIKNTCCISNEEDAVNHFLHIDKTIQICITESIHQIQKFSKNMIRLKNWVSKMYIYMLVDYLNGYVYKIYMELAIFQLHIYQKIY